jgi:hypothetical protein
VYAGKVNHIQAELMIVTFVSDLNKTAAVYGVKGAVLTGNTAYTDIDTSNSILSVSTGGTILSGVRGPATVLRAGQDRRTDVSGTGIKLFPGETFTFEVEPGGPVNGTFSISARFKEFH